MLRHIAVASLFVLVFANLAFSQGGNAQLGGIVLDQSKALIPGATITVTNTETGITNTAITNESGSYNFPSLQPGKAYKVSASLPGFQTRTVTDLELPIATNNRQDFSLSLAATATTVEVSAAANAVNTGASASVGDVLSIDRIRNLPLVSNNVLDLLDILPGMRTSPVGNAFTTIGGLGLDSINTTRDGLSITDGRYSAQTYGTQVFSPTTINPDLVGEIRLILSPVDAELGRGNAQIQIQTRSGTNRYTGSAVWTIQNSALNSNTWANNRNTVAGVWTPIKPDWNNTNQFTLSYGGPIIRNKTFFYALWDQRINNTRDTQNVTVMTDTARQGIFRYFTGYNPTNLSGTQTPLPATATTAVWRSVNDLGQAVAPLLNPDGVTPYTGGLRCFSVFGNVKVDGSPFTQTDCAGGTAVIGPAWDSFRTTFDKTGYIKKIIDLMPHANDFNAGDGLNTARYRWIRGRNGSNSVNAIVGSDAYTNFKQINLKLDHNFTSNHKVSGNISYQLDDSGDNVAQWPDGFTGVIRRRPFVATINATSTLSSNLLNEARFGMNHNKTATLPPWLNADLTMRSETESFLMKGGTAKNGYVYPVVINPSVGNYGYAGGNGALAPNASQIGNTTPLYNYADTLSWTKGKHAFKFGAELRLPRSNGYNLQPLPLASIGGTGSGTATTPFPTLTNFATELPGLLGAVPMGNTTPAARNSVRDMLYFLNGSVSGVALPLWIENSENQTKGTWEDVSTKGGRFRDGVAQEWNAFVKDDFKITRRLTLNIGLRYEFYGSPYLRSGLTSAPVGLGDGLFGAGRISSGNLFDDYLSPGNLYLTGYGSTLTASGPLACVKGVIQAGITSTCDPALQTGLEFIGPNTPNPGKVAIPNDRNNFGPAVGFAWQFPWFGEGKTTVRGGYQITYQGTGRNFMSNDALLGSAPGTTLTNGFNVGDADIAAILSTRATNLGDLPLLVPRLPTRAPGQTLPIYGRSAAATAYDPNYATPYTENFTLSVTRQLTRGTSLDVRYVGTMGKKLPGNLGLNDSTVFHNAELMDAIFITRAGGNAPLFDQMLAGLNLNVGVAAADTTKGTYAAIGTVNAAGVYQSGSMHLRRNATFAANLANGNFEAVANSLVTLAPAANGGGLQPLPAGVTFAAAPSQRALRNGCDRIANGLTNIPTRCFPEDYLIANPQFSTVTYNANLGHSNNQSLQINLNARPIQGITFTSTYSFSKTMELPGTGFTDPINRNAYDYQRGRGPLHNFRTNGTFELPIGPNKLLMGNSSGWMARLVERWSTSIIFNGSSGSPSDITGNQTLYGNGRPNVVSPYWKIPSGHSKWVGGNTGAFYGNPNPYVGFRDPQCTNSVGAADGMGFNLQASCTLNAMAGIAPQGTPGAFQLTNGQWAVPLLQNAEPGKQGTLGLRSINYWGTHTFDANIGKTFRISESKSAQIRIDARNVLNRRQMGIPSQAMNNFGVITGKGGQIRTFQGQLRLSF